MDSSSPDSTREKGTHEALVTDESVLNGDQNGGISMNPVLDVEEGTMDDIESVEIDVGGIGIVHERPSLRRRPSVVYRRLPENILLNPSVTEEAIVNAVPSNLSEEEKSKSFQFDLEDEVVRKCCLNPTHTFRRQMMISFGILNVTVILLVVLICVGMGQFIGIQSSDFLRTAFKENVTETLNATGRYLADAFTEEIILTDAVQLIHDVIVDRFDGYPDPTDDGVPFLDMESERNVYPITANPMPLFWDIQPNVDEENYEEFLQGSRWSSYRNIPVDTTNAGFQFQGSCDPSINDPTDPTYAPNCTDSNNDIKTGGIFAPSELAEMYHRKGSDLVPIFRSFFETRQSIREIYVHFLNDGAGAGMIYPQYTSGHNFTYTSIGCDWLLEPNRYKPGETIGTMSMIEKCRANGIEVPMYLYNALEREWCKEQALDPDSIFIQVRYDPFTDQDYIQIGKSIYDRTSKDFIGCMYIGVDMHKVHYLLRRSLSKKEDVNMIVSFDERGLIVATSSDNSTFGAPKRLMDSDSPGNITEEWYAELLNQVDYDSLWDPKKVLETYQKFSQSATEKNDEFIVSIAPIPSIPREYEKSYRPHFFMVGFFYDKIIDDKIEKMLHVVEDYQSKSTLFATTMGAAGIVIAMVLISIMAYVLTSPLTKMNKVASDIVENFGDSKKEDEINFEKDALVVSRCTPKTEVMDVVSEFNKMVDSFSGVSEAKSEKQIDEDMLNNFPGRTAFFGLYKTRDAKSFEYNLTEDTMELCNSEHGISFKYLGLNYSEPDEVIEKKDTNENEGLPRIESKKISPLFLWTLLLLVIPLLLILISISAVVMKKLVDGFDKVNNEMINLTLGLAEELTEVTVRLRSDYLAKLTERSTDDLAILSRYATWLLFGGLNQSNYFSKVLSDVEDCKDVGGNLSVCGNVQENVVCDCKWQQIGFEATCTNYNESVRNREVIYWMSEVSEHESGDRLSTSFPNSSNSPETTAWWDDAMRLPGFQIESNGLGYDTSFDRLRAISGIPIFQPLKNYRPGNSPLATLTLGVAFEADGMFIHYQGCDTVSANAAYSSWKSTLENKGADFRPELCPVGKYGYDPRCRGWYDEGRDRSLSNDTHNRNLVYVTAPYQFARGKNILYGQTATYAIVHPSTGEHIGQTLIDFNYNYAYDVLRNQTTTWGNGEPVLITMSVKNGDTVIAPGVSPGQPSSNISSIIMPHDTKCGKDNECQKRLNTFNQIVEQMKEGERKTMKFSRKTENGKIEDMSMHYEPVNIYVADPINGSDYARGVRKRPVLVYSLGFLVKDQESTQEASRALLRINKYFMRGVAVLAVVIIIATATSAYMSHLLATSFTATMRHLLGILRYINTHGDNQTSPPNEDARPSYETVVLSGTLEALYRIVKFANSAFFAGELGSAYHILIDVLRLFRRLDNKKAIGIASNNLGNTLLSIYREMKELKVNELYELTMDDVVSQGIAHFHTAITVGEKTYDDFYNLQGWSPLCLNFMQHLANRYFNRGMFLLIVKNDHNDPSEIERLGLRDLQIADDMDHEVVAYGEEIGWGGNERVANRFNVNITRIKGYIILCSKGYDPGEHDWRIDELIEGTIALVNAERKKKNSKLFSAIGYSGRLQELELQLMRYKLVQNDIEVAAMIAVRMLIEDEYIFVEAMRQAISVLIKYAESDKVEEDFGEKILPVLEQYQGCVGKMIAKKKEDLMSSYSDTLSLTTRSTGQSAHSLGSRGIIMSIRASLMSSDSYRSRLSYLEQSKVSDIFVTMEDF